ncbi:major facilitator superfamily domain-containing protein [Desarmillaria tabescens]|uniref:Major facilitator superfamily domain-containing protein n=1 Tax=Armillaria tabescens TaxID=1929756 RepID=A0AA39N7S8_ARMTA|nr:major facilitator superfamily domain-containing protein [Desarmillaria tabescens]KAK0460609.1 major facilitator superfamily domain-containing protein [Desarmillaria tabescens]
MQTPSYVDTEGPDDHNHEKSDPGSKAEEPLTATSEPVSYPEGGLSAWRTICGVYVCALVQFSTFGYTNAYGVYNGKLLRTILRGSFKFFADFYVREYMTNISSSQLSWIGSVQLMLVLSVGLFSGRLYDTGYFYHLMIGGAFLFVFSLFMLSLTAPGQYYQVFLAQGIGAGLAIGIMYIPGIAVVSHYFQRRRTFAMGIATSGSGLGGAVQPIMLNRLFYGRVGFHNGVRISAAFNAGVLIIALLLMRTRLPPTPRKDGSTLLHMRAFFREGPYIATVVGTMFILAGLYFPIFFLQLSAIKNGINANLAFYVLPVLNAFTILGRVIPSLFVHRMGIYNFMIPCVASCSVLIYCTLTVKTVAATYIIALLYGLFVGAYLGFLAPMVGSLAKRDSEIGARMGICFTFTGFGGLVGNPISGALLTSSYIWWRPSLFAGLCVTCGAILFTFARFGVARQKGTHRV